MASAPNNFHTLCDRINKKTKTEELKRIFNDIVKEINNDQTKMCQLLDRLNNKIDPATLLDVDLLNHGLILLLKHKLTDILIKWHSTAEGVESMTKTDELFYNRMATLLSEIRKLFNSDTSSEVYTIFLSNMPFLDVMKQILNDMVENGKHLNSNDDDYNLHNFQILLDVFKNFDTSTSEAVLDIINPSILPLVDLIVSLLSSSFYADVLKQLSVDTSNLTVVENFLLINCFEFLDEYRGKQNADMNDKLMKNMGKIYSRFLKRCTRRVERWQTPVITVVKSILNVMISCSDIKNTYTSNRKLKKLINYLIIIVSDTSLCDSIQETNSNPETQLIDSAVTLLHNMTHDPELLCLLNEMDVNPTFMILKDRSAFNRIKINAYIILVATSSEQEFLEHTDPENITTIFIEFLKEANEATSKTYWGIPLTSILQGLETLVQPEEIKTEFVKQDPQMKLLEGIIMKSSDEDEVLERSLNILSSMTFHANVAEVLRENAELLNRLETLAKLANNEDYNNNNNEENGNNKTTDDNGNTSQNTDTTQKQIEDKENSEEDDSSSSSDDDDDASGKTKDQENEEVVIEVVEEESKALIIGKIATAILWQIQQKPLHETEKADDGGSHSVSTHQDVVAHSKKKWDIMISYSHDNAKICRLIDKKLNSNGFKVWIDVRNLHGFMPQRIAEAIETSSIVIIGVSQSYKNSAWCRSEAAYAYQRRTPIIPLKLTSEYVADGWLGFITAGFTQIRFNKLTFRAAYSQLLAEIKHAQSELEKPTIPAKSLSESKKPITSKTCTIS